MMAADRTAGREDAWSNLFDPRRNARLGSVVHRTIAEGI
jgi:hypothetical protein